MSAYFLLLIWEQYLTICNKKQFITPGNISKDFRVLSLMENRTVVGGISPTWFQAFCLYLNFPKMLQVYTDGETNSQRIMRPSYAIVSGFYIIAVYQVT